MAGMGKNAGIVRLWIIAASIVGLLSDCTPDEDVSGAANVTTTFKLKSPSAMEGKITIREVYLKLDRIQVTGNLNGKTITDFTHPVPAEDPPYQLSRADSSQVYFSLPGHVYDQLNFNLYLLQDNYELTFQSQPVEEIPDPIEENDDQNGVDQPADDGGDENENEDGDGGSENGNDGNSDDGNSGDDDNEDSGDDGNSGDGNSDNGNSDDGNSGDGNSGDGNSGDGNSGDGDNGDSDDDGDDDAGSDNDEGKDKNKGNENKGDKGKDDDKNKGDKGDDDKDDDDKDDDDEDDGRTSDKKNVNVVDLDHFFQNAKPGMVILATYENNGKFANIIFVAAGIENFSIPAKQDDSFNIVLTQQNTAQVTFDPQSWFEGLGTADIESANRQIHQEQEVIFIHPGFNSHLFEILAPRLAESADLNFTSN